MSDDKRLDRTRRLIIAGGAGSLIIGGLTTRLANLQLMSDDKFLELAKENGVSREAAPSRRGLIYDRFGEPLATHRTTWNVFAAREDIDDIPELLNRIGDLVEISDARRQRILRQFRQERPFIPVSILNDLTYEQFTRLSVQRANLPGVSIESAEARSYPRGRDFAHILGYVAKPNRAEIDAAIEGLNPETERDKIRRIERVYKHPNMRVGRLGVERRADAWLRGTPGVHRFVKNAKGRVLERLPDGENAPQPGSDIYLTIDASLQKAAIEVFGEQTGAAVVLDMQSADVLALVSTPTFDPNDFVNGISNAEYTKLRDSEFSPLYHKAYDGVYPPGSTFKMVVASAAIKAGIDPNERINCPGHYDFGTRRWSCWKRTGHGPVNMHDAMKVSCDTYFYEISQRIGHERIAEEARLFGLGERFELGITGGARGIVPDDAWKRARFNEPWYDGETLNYGIGQGYLTSSPLQLAVMTARLAQNSSTTPFMPRLIGVGPNFGQSPAQGVMPSQEILEKLRAAMYAVTSERGGTALRAGDIGFHGIRMAGKTGTAQVRYISQEERREGVLDNDELPRRLRDHGLFVGYAPYDNPRYAISVVVEHGGGGSSAAAPVARDIMRKTFELASGREPAFQYALGPDESERI